MIDGDREDRWDKRCIECPVGTEQLLEGICSSCGRCLEHCHAMDACFASPKREQLVNSQVRVRGVLFARN